MKDFWWGEGGQVKFLWRMEGNTEISSNYLMSQLMVINWFST